LDREIRGECIGRIGVGRVHVAKRLVGRDGDRLFRHSRNGRIGNGRIVQGQGHVVECDSAICKVGIGRSHVAKGGI